MSWSSATSGTNAILEGIINRRGFLLKGNIDCSGNPNYPAAVKGDAYRVSVAGKIGGASGDDVDVGDLVVASATNAGGNKASVGSSWFALERNTTSSSGVSVGKVLSYRMLQ